MTARLAALCACFLAAAGARAQPDDIAPAFRAFLASDGYERVVVGAAFDADVALFPDCADRTAKTRTLVGRLERVVFVKNRAAPVDGRWLERLAFDRCGETAFQTIMFSIDDEGEIQAQPLLAGETRVLDPRTQLAVARTVYASDLRQAGGCGDRQIVDTRIATQPVGAEGSWMERWSVRACGAVRAHSVLLSPADGGGLRYLATPAGAG